MKKMEAMVLRKPTDAATHLFLPSLPVLQILHWLVSSLAGCGAVCSGVFTASKHCYLNYSLLYFTRTSPLASQNPKRPLTEYTLSHWNKCKGFFG